MSDLILVLKAAQFAADKHRGQKRKDIDASPYINHPIKVALIIAEIGGINDPEVLAAALLHDTIEDTDTKPSELDIFGETVRKYVEEVTDNKELEKSVRKQKQIEHAATLSAGATLIKLGDKIANVSDVISSPPPDWDYERRKQYLDWAEKVINNCPKVNSSLELLFSEKIREGRKLLLNELSPAIFEVRLIDNSCLTGEVDTFGPFNAIEEAIVVSKWHTHRSIECFNDIEQWRENGRQGLVFLSPNVIGKPLWSCSQMIRDSSSVETELETVLRKDIRKYVTELCNAITAQVESDLRKIKGSEYLKKTTAVM